MGKDPELAMRALEAYSTRYRAVAKAAAIAFPTALEFEVVEDLAGDASTDFGVPGRGARAEADPLEAVAAERLANLLKSAWNFFEVVASKAPEQLRKGPRGGGRDTSALLDHVHNAEDIYSRKIGIRVKDWEERRLAFLSTVRAGGSSAGGWSLAYSTRRTAWHALDHAWEIEDKSQ